MTSLTNRSTFSLMDFGRNNLADSSSPYLRQHGDNPVWWQEWSPEVLAHAKKEDKPLLVSVGYSTCHWCHVMAADAFSNEEIAEVLNRDFVTIKVDREQRPDIDQYLMSFLVATTGNGGWPLNAFLTPNGHPFFAMTYAASTPRFSMPAFSDILTQVSEFYSNRKEEIRAFEVPAVRTDTGGADGGVDFSQISKQIESVYDHEYAGFGSSQKFPPHATLLFLLYASATQADEPAGQALLRYATGTLDAMKDGGLHDHLQGGFYRYCVDRSWTIPHFEKMLYDQAMLLWTYSLASRVANSDDYREVSDGVFRSLEETFRMGDLYAAAHDADTDHHEGDTYVWSLEEIESILDGAELEAFREYFDVTQSGNFEGRNHIVKRRPDDSGNDITGVDAAALERATETLLAARKARVQPFRDEKLLSAWNSLAGCGLVAAHRFAGTAGAFERARQIAQRIAEDVSPSGVVPHDIAHPNEGGSFLADHAAYALLLLMLGEESNEFDTVLKTVMANLMSFREDGAWFESSNDDFRRMPADTFDSPSPSSSALADMAVLIDKVRSHQEYADLPVGNPLAHGFAGLAGLISQGHFHAVERPSPIPWSTLPVNTIQFQGEKTVDCYRGVCLMNLDHLIHDKKTDG